MRALVGTAPIGAVVLLLIATSASTGQAEEGGASPAAALADVTITPTELLFEPRVEAAAVDGVPVRIETR